MEIESIPAKKKVVFSQDEVRQTREVAGKLNGMAGSLNQMVNGAERNTDEFNEIVKSLAETKRDIDKYFEQFLEQVNSLK